MNPATRPGKTEAPGSERRAAARALFEGQPGATCETVAAETGVPVGTVRRWKAEGGWKPTIRALPDLSVRAGELANKFKVRMSELGKPLDDAVAAEEASREIATGFAVDVRADVLDRHRKEWAAPRKIAYDAIKQGTEGKDVPGAFERAKLAKITSETLTLIQAGECRAYGINHDARGADARTLVVVERGADPVPESEASDVPAISPTPGTSTSSDDEVF